MNHFSQTRLLELSTHSSTTLDIAEAAHLAVCNECAEELREQRKLTAALRAITQPQAPADFVSTATARFAVVMTSRRKRSTAVSIAVSVALFVLLAVPMLWIAAVDVATVLGNSVELVREVIAVIATAQTLAQSVPMAGLAVLAVAASSMAVAAWAFAQAVLVAGNRTTARPGWELRSISE